MKVYFGSDSLDRRYDNAVVALGNFDGVHIGHQRLIFRMRELAEKKNAASVVYTFDPHPVQVLAPDAAPLLIQTLEQKLRSIEDLGVDVCVVEKFTKEFAKHTARSFVENVLLQKIGAGGVVVGYDFTFAFQRSGCVEDLQRIGAESGIDVFVMEPQFLGDMLLSSTEIRNFIQEGRVDQANTMLGRLFCMQGIVVKGKGRGGRLGAHTANVQPDNSIIPGGGVYLTLTGVDHEEDVKSITSIGFNPTFHQKEMSIETHLIEFTGDLLGKRISVKFIEKIRDQIAFPSPQALIVQIKEDIKGAKELHEKRSDKKC